MDNIEQVNEAPEVDDVEINEDAQETPKMDLRRSLSKNMKQEVESEEESTSDEDSESDEAPSEPEEEISVEPVQQPVIERIPLVPPADMNKLEKEAFLNPTADNAHVLQQYMNRRAYETRTDYQRKMQEVEDLRKQTSGIYDTIKQYETDYAKEGISLGDLAKRSIAWDKAMRQNPIETAREWLESYGVNIQDLSGNSGQSQYGEQNGYQPPQTQQYLTREDAERIADEKFKAIQAEQEQNAVAYYNERVVESFVNSKPLFKDPETAAQLEAEMAPIVQALKSTGKYSSPEEILSTAYNYVVAGNPTFSSLNSAMTAKPVIEQKVAAAQKAKAASKSISGSAGSGTPRVQVKDLRDNLRRRMTGD